MEIPSIRYARTGDGVRIPYWTRGRGRPLLLSPNVQVGHAQAEWSVPTMRRWFERLAGSFTLVRYDHRAGGLSITRGSAPHMWELDALTRDIDAVLEATATGKAVLVGWLAGAIPALAYAARNPDRVSHLVLWNGFPATGATASRRVCAPCSRCSGEVLILVEVSGVTPGHVYLYEIVAFDHPEHCRHGSTQFPEPSPCWSAGAENPVDGAIPEAGHFVAAFGAKVARGDRVAFAFDLMQDTPTEVFHGSALTNPAGAWIAVGVLDKGPELPETDSLRDAQFNSIRRGCQGPPFFGPLHCEFVGVQQHLPR